MLRGRVVLHSDANDGSRRRQRLDTVCQGLDVLNVRHSALSSRHYAFILTSKSMYITYFTAKYNLNTTFFAPLGHYHPWHVSVTPQRPW